MGEISTAWRSREVAAVLRWLRRYNAGHDDKVQFVGVEFFSTRDSAYDAVADHVARVAPEGLCELDRLAPLRPRFPTMQEHVGWYVSQTDKQPYVRHAQKVHALVEGLPHRKGDRAWELALHHARQILSFYEYFALPWGSEQIDYRDEHAAENLRWWRRRTGDKIVYWAASAHTANAPGLVLSAPPAPEFRWDSVGSYLRRWYGRKYLSIGFTFDHGTVNINADEPPFGPEPVAVPRPPRDWAERPLGDVGLEQYWLDLRAGAPPAVRAWRTAPTRTRALAGFDPEQPDAYYVTGGSLVQWFDVIIHRQTVTPWRPL
jgi:erythromycin esterase